MKSSEFFRKIFTKKILIAVIILAMIAGGFLAYKKINSSAKIQYKTITAKAQDFSISVSGMGNVIVDQSSSVEPTITGSVSNLAVNVGDKVEKGQFLFDIVNDELGVEAEKAYAAYYQSLEDLETAKADRKQAKYDLSKSNAKQKSALKQKVDASKASISYAEENVKSALKSYQYEKADAAKRKVTAPIAGTVNAINIKNGDDLKKLSSGSSRVVPMIIGDLSTMKAQVQVSEVDITDVSIGQEAEMTFNAIDGLLSKGKVEKIDPLGYLASGVVTFNVIVGFDDLDSRIKPQMTVTASFIKKIKDDVFAVPNSAVKKENNEYYVEVLLNNSPRRKKVQIGESNNTLTEILSGIDAGDAIVVQTIDPKKTTNTSQSNPLRTPNIGGGRSGMPHIH